MFHATTKTKISYEILKTLDHRQLFSKYLGIYPEFGKKYLSPFRNDKSPGCRFELRSGLLYFVENTAFQGRLRWSIFDIVMYFHKCGFEECLEIISNDIDPAEVPQQIHYHKQPFRINFTYKDWPSENMFYLPNDILQKENVFLVDDYWTGSLEMRKNNIYNPKTNLTVAYYFPETDHTKLYFPEQENFKFSTNCNSSDIHGKNKIEYYRHRDRSHIIITKSQKDRLVLDYHCGYNAIAVLNEGCHLDPSFIKELKEKFLSVYVLFDNDDTGRKMSKIFSEKYGIFEIKLNEKDPYEQYNKYGRFSIFL